MRKRNLVIVCGQRKRRRRRVFVGGAEAEVKNFDKTGSISGKDNHIELEAKNKGDVVAIGKGSRNSVTNTDNDNGNGNYVTDDD